MEAASVRPSFLKRNLFLSVTQCMEPSAAEENRQEPRGIVLYLFSRMFVNKVETQQFSQRPVVQYGNREARFHRWLKLTLE